MEHQGHEHNGCCKSSNSGVSQSLSEMEFERGIWYAAQTNDIDRVKKLLAKGTNPSLEDSAGYTALHYAARSGNLDVCQLLLNRGANVNAVTRSGQATALHRAATQTNDKIIQLLLNFRADPNIRDADGFTPLHRAAMTGGRSTWNLLVAKTDQTLLDNNGRTALNLCKWKNNE